MRPEFTMECADYVRGHINTAYRNTLSEFHTHYTLITNVGVFHIDKVAAKGEHLLKVVLSTNGGINEQAAYYRHGQYAAEDIVRVVNGEQEYLEDHFVLKGDTSIFGPDDARRLRELLPERCNVRPYYGNYIVDTPRTYYYISSRVDGIKVDRRDPAGIIASETLVPTAEEAVEAIAHDVLGGFKGLNHK